MTLFLPECLNKFQIWFSIKDLSILRNSSRKSLIAVVSTKLLPWWMKARFCRCIYGFTLLGGNMNEEILSKGPPRRTQLRGYGARRLRGAH